MAVKVVNRPDDFTSWCGEFIRLCQNDLNIALLDDEQFLPLKKLQETLEAGFTISQCKMARIAPWPIFVDFIEQQEHYLWLIALIAMILVALVTLPLARHLVEPIKLIAQGMHKLTQGNYKQIITLKRQDELGELSRDFNELALTLVENDSARKRWLANISHELRTPVSILRGELEAMLDNVRPLNKDNITSANEEVIHLQRLIDDLNLLTSTDIGGMRYRKKNQSLTSLLCEVVDKYSRYLKDANITLNLEIKNKEIVVFIDKTRVFQLFENIINNCIKYSSASRLNIKVSVKNLEGIASVIIKFEDNGVGVDDVHLPHLFEHLYLANLFFE